jgi:drug/metabolite transporter (DMT)-like permease
MKNELRKGYIALALVSFFWGTTYIASKIGTRHMPGLFIAGVRQFSSGLIMVGFFLLRGYRLPTLSDIKKISVQGLLLLCLANGMLTWSLEYISSGLAAIIAAMVPLFVTLFSIWLSKTAKITRWMTLGLLLGFAGVVTICYDYIGQLGNKNFIVGIVMAFLSAISWSFGTVYTSGQKLSINILFGVGFQMLIAGTVILLICFASGRYANLAETGHESWYALLYLIIFGSILAYSAYMFAIKKLPTTQASLYAYINPIVAVLCGWLLLSEKMNIHMITGTMITLGGVFLVNYVFKKQKA